jgi:hypothetical protein
MSAGGGGNFIANTDGYPEWRISTIGGGLFAFFDATYVEADLGLLFGSQNFQFDTSIIPDYSTDVSFLTFGLFGKYPFDLGICSLFPMFGFQYSIGLSSKYDGKDIYESSAEKATWMNQFWVKFGIGADFNLTDKLYLRPSYLFGINFGTEAAPPESGYLHIGNDIRVALGFKF